VVRTYAPVGQTPILRVSMRREHVSAISGITMDGRLFTQSQERAYRSVDVVGFLEHLLQCIEGKLLVIWDGAPIHRGEPVKKFLADGGAKRVQLEQLPGYAPDLNPAEGVWRHLKRVDLRNVCCADLASLRDNFRRAVKRLRHKREILQSCIRLAGYHA
jgi:transposase